MRYGTRLTDTSAAFTQPMLPLGRTGQVHLDARRVAGRTFTRNTIGIVSTDVSTPETICRSGAVGVLRRVDVDARRLRLRDLGPDGLGGGGRGRRGLGGGGRRRGSSASSGPLARARGGEQDDRESERASRRGERGEVTGTAVNLPVAFDCSGSPRRHRAGPPG